MFGHARLLAHIGSTCWAVEERWGQTFLRIASRRVGLAEEPLPEALNEAFSARAARDARRGENLAISAGVAVIPIYGMIVPRASMYSEISGAVSAQQISAQLSAALADESVSSILLDIDSPGGDVMGMTELAAEIHAARAKKPVTAIANGMAASGAYWLGSQATEIMATPSGLVGSIGVYSVHENWAEAAKQAGVEHTFIYAGKYKTEGNEFAPLGAEAKDHVQSLVDGYYAAFTRDVARGRGVAVANVRGGMGQGRVLAASNAKAAGMVDSIGTFAAAISRARQLTGAGRVSQRDTAAMEARLAFLARKEREVLLTELEFDLKAH